MYLNLIQIAESFGVSESVVEGWIRDEGLPHTPDRGRMWFDRAQVADWATRRGLAAQAGFLAPEASALGTGLRLDPLLRAGGIWRNVAVADLPAAFERIVVALPGGTPQVRALMGQRLRARGGVTLAPVGDGFALPHPSARMTLGRDSGALALLFLRDPLPSAEPVPDRVPITRLCFFFPPSPRLYLQLLACLGRLVAAQGPLRDMLLRNAADEEIRAAVVAADAPAEGASAGRAKP